MSILEIAVFLLVMYVLINPLYSAYLFTRPPRFRVSFRTPKDWGSEFDAVTLHTSDGVDLDGWYIPSRNGAAVILLHGHSGNRLAMTFHAEKLIAAGYGVLLYDLRAHGSSGGRHFTRGQTAPEDVLAGVTYLSKRPDVNAGGIGVMGVSVGGMLALQAAARTVAIRAIVADGPGITQMADLPEPSGWWGRVLQFRQLYYMKMIDWFTREPDLPATRSVIGAIAPRPVLLISTGQGGEQRVVRQYQAAAGENTYLWQIAEAAHASGHRVRPDEYAHKLVTFFDQTLTRTDDAVMVEERPFLAELFPPPQPPTLAEDVAYDATSTMLQANMIAILLVPIAFALFLGPFWLIWGEFVTEAQGVMDTAVWLRAILIFLGSIVVHELLHAIGYIYVGKARWSEVKFGFSWRGLAPYAHCHAVMNMSAYRVAVMLPGIVLGITPAIVGLVVGSYWLTFFGAVMVMAAGGDLAVLLATRGVPATATVRDHPSKPGCEVLKDIQELGSSQEPSSS
jgi:pimeloyl-ACP methyl ester carboxylesterase